MKKTGMPQRYELVVCQIEQVHPNSVTVKLLEYGITGIVHVSEVALRWVTDIREFVRERQILVCKVMRVEGDHISLSIKRVRKGEGESKLNEFNRERKTEKVLELAAQSFGKTLEQAYEEIGDILIEEFGSLTKAFELAKKRPELLEQKKVPKKWVAKIKELVEKSDAHKVYTVKAKLSLTSYAPNGVEKIKQAFEKNTQKELTFHYISAPLYMIVGKGSDHRKIETLIEKTATAIVKEVEKHGEGSWELEGR